MLCDALDILKRLARLSLDASCGKFGGAGHVAEHARQEEQLVNTHGGREGQIHFFHARHQQVFDFGVVVGRDLERSEQKNGQEQEQAFHRSISV